MAMKRRTAAVEPASISPAALRRYLKAWGWHIAEPRSVHDVAIQSPAARALLRERRPTTRSFDVFVSDGDYAGVELVVPQTADGADTAQLIQRVLGAVAQIRDLSVSEVVADVLSVGFDVIMSTIPSEYIVQETVSFDQARRLINGMREVLASTATTELEPRPFFSRLKKEGAEYADHCRFGHTFKGSFGFTLESPIVPPLQGELDGIEPAIPFERRVVTRFARGLKAIHEATAAQSPELIVEASRVAFGANACEHFADMVEETSERMTFAVAFSPEWHLQNRVELSQSFSVGPQHVEVARAAAKQLRDQLKPWQETVVGRVVQLANHEDPSDLFGPSGEREVVIQWNGGELGVIHVRASLAPKDYLDAIDAHASGKIVSVSGLLDRRGRRWMLFDVSGFTVLL